MNVDTLADGIERGVGRRSVHAVTHLHDKRAPRMFRVSIRYGIPLLIVVFTAVLAAYTGGDRLVLRRPCLARRGPLCLPGERGRSPSIAILPWTIPYLRVLLKGYTSILQNRSTQSPTEAGFRNQCEIRARCRRDTNPQGLAVARVPHPIGLCPMLA